MLIRDDLLSCGFLSCDIKKLVDGGYITKDSHNHYIKDELNYFINVPKIRYVATGKAENSSEYLFEADPIEVSFKIKEH